MPDLTQLEQDILEWFGRKTRWVTCAEVSKDIDRASPAISGALMSLARKCYLERRWYKVRVITKRHPRGVMQRSPQYRRPR